MPLIYWLVNPYSPFCNSICRLAFTDWAVANVWRFLSLSIVVFSGVK
jgi:hypothetical protein